MVPTNAENAAMWSDLADTPEDRVSESLVDYEDEREAVEAVVPGMIASVH
jgi:hypothetical protein